MVKFAKLPLMGILYIFLLAALVSVVVFSFYFYQPYQASFSSNFEVASADEGLVLSFDLAPSEKEGLENFARKVEWPWQGEEVRLALNDNLKGWLRPLLPLRVGVKSETLGLRLKADSLKLPSSSQTQLWFKANLAPRNSLAYGQIPQVLNLIDLPGQAVFKSVEETPTFVLFPVNEKISFAFLGKVTSPAIFEAEIKKLREVQSESQGRTEGAGTGYNESQIKGIKVYSVTSSDSVFVPTYGLLGDSLVAASDPVAFGLMVEVFRREQPSLAETSNFEVIKAQLPPDGAGSLYFNLESLRNWDNFSFQDALKPYLDLELSQSFNAEVLKLSRLGPFGVAWTKEGSVEGYLTYDLGTSKASN
jgi:hypothetical protein